jgi:Na+/H+ antiporter NhaD/arsenite permease-like protein
VSRDYSLRKIFWITGALSFLISPIADNLTTALLMGAVILAVGGKNNAFIAIACINVIVAANAGGAFSPFGDITTLMVWQKGKIEFTRFFLILLPSLFNWLIPAFLMSLSIKAETPSVSGEKIVMKRIARAEWDTLLFFYGVILCVGGLSQFGYLGLISGYLYTDLGATIANTLLGLVSAVIDNIPVMLAVLMMDPSMSEGQWLLVTLTAGTGGSLLAIGSAAGVAVMGSARGIYTFGSHLKWAPAIAAGYAASIITHMLVNRSLF